jgi:membrane fusion protein (multidrug efflux system)
VIEPQLDEETRSTRVVAVLDNPELRLRPGMSATVTLVLAERAQALTVPSQAVFVTGGQSFVYVVKADSTVARAAVQLGTRLTDVVEVTGGLDSGQQVVTAGHQKLYDGARVMPVGGGAPGEPGAAGAQGGSSR